MKPDPQILSALDLPPDATLEDVLRAIRQLMKEAGATTAQKEVAAALGVPVAQVKADHVRPMRLKHKTPTDAHRAVSKATGVPIQKVVLDGVQPTAVDGPGVHHGRKV